jgi:hypothetical protein
MADTIYCVICGHHLLVHGSKTNREGGFMRRECDIDNCDCGSKVYAKSVGHTAVAA